MNKPSKSRKAARGIRSEKRKSASQSSKTRGRGSASKRAAAPARLGTKQALLIDLLKRPKGATIADLVQATGWQAHSVRGAISGALKKKLGLSVTSEKVQARGRVYRIAGTR